MKFFNYSFYNKLFFVLCSCKLKAEIFISHTCLPIVEVIILRTEIAAFYTSSDYLMRHRFCL